jgi:antitoxin StbD
MDRMLASRTVSVTELKRNFSQILQEVADAPVAVLNHNRPAAYLLSAQYYGQLLAKLEELERKLGISPESAE